MESEHSERILVVDDEKRVCSMLLEFLRQEGYNCRSTTDPVEALAILEQNDFDLVISDIRMQGMSGLELLRELRIKHPGIDTIVMTAFTSDHTYMDIIEAGAADFIGKPFKLPELKAKIERVNRERRMLRELQETNTALGVVLKRVEGDKEKLDADILSNLQQLIFPYLDKLRGTRLDEKQVTYVNILHLNLLKITSPFMRNLSQKRANLSHMEIQIANLIKAGKDSKEIADILGVSINTVTTHRYHLRTKLGLKGEKVTLKSHLKSIDFLVM
jgi:DNA-binding response OmpR family regulator